MSEQLSLQEKQTANSSKASDPEVIQGQGEVAVIEPTRGAVAEVPAPSEATTMLQVIERAALNPNIDVEKMERLLAMHERIVDKENQAVERALAWKAEQEFNAAMTKTQSALPQITKDKENTQTESTYASLENVMKGALPVITENGFSLSFEPSDSPKPDHHRIICTVSHVGGHSRKYTADLPADTKGPQGTANKTQIHGFGSTTSYGRRYLTMMIFNITVKGEDRDGNQPGDFITEGQLAEIVALIEETGADVPKLCEYFKIGSVTEIPAKMFVPVRNRLLEKKKKAGSKK